MPKKEDNNYAFIDAQNLYLGIRELGWKLDYKRFRVYLREKYQVSKAFIFIGYLKKNEGLYDALKRWGYTLIFKDVVVGREGEVKGNVDAELVLQAMIEYDAYEKAVVVTSDGDFACLVKHLYDNGKLAVVFSPHLERSSILLRRAAKERIVFAEKLRTRLAYTKK